MAKKTQSASPEVNIADGPLMVSEINPRYFTVARRDVAERQAIYLTGSHIWHNFHDGMGPGSDCDDATDILDFDDYLNFLKEHGHNFIRLWRWEQFKSQAAGGNYHLCMTPQPWARTGPGEAKDGKPKFDLDSFDSIYFDRLRERVIAAGEEGIYVGVMFFDGWALHLSPVPDNVEGHPFHAKNNINEISITSIVDYQVLPLDTRVQAYQEAFIKKVIDTVQDLPNVLYEVANESSGGGVVDKQFAEALGLDEPPDWGNSTQWQYWVINTVKQYEQQMGYAQHPIGMTMQFPVPEQTKVNDPLYNSPADWISPGYDDEIFRSGEHHPMAPGSPPSRWSADPPASDGRKIILTDTDHYAPHADALWAWKSFLRGHHPILMDYGIISGVNPADPTAGSPGVPSYTAFEAARYAMGDTLTYAQKLNLIEMEPRVDISSTGFALANPGEEYLILQPTETSDPFTVLLEAGTYIVEWFSVNSHEIKSISEILVEHDGNNSFLPPFEETGPVVLWIKKI